MFKIFNGRTSFYQWDTDQKLIITADIVDYQVHFENPSSESCFVVAPYELENNVVVNVPNILLQSINPIVVWCYALDDNGNYTVKSATFAVIERQKPSDYVYTETEVGGRSTLPITYLTSPDRTNPQELCKIDSGIYILCGYFTPYTGSGRNISYDNRLAICDVNTNDGTRYFQVFSPYKNTVMYLVVTESTYERTDTELSGIITKVDAYLSDSSTYPLQNKVITEALSKLETRIAALEGT